jgi:hypothetical protein
MQDSGRDVAPSLFDATDLIGTFHRIAGIGPSYQVVELLNDRFGAIVVGRLKDGQQ